MANQVTLFKHEAPIAFGSNEEIQAIIERMEALVPVRLDSWQLSQPDIVKNRNDAYLKTAQLSVFYRLIPGVDVHIIPFGRGFAVDTGVSTWQKAADRYCAQHGITYHAIYEEMPTEELRKRRGEKLYSPNDVGAICYIWRSDKKEVYDMFGGKQALTKGYGHWAERARYDNKNKEWKADEIPAQRTKQDVARRRALKAALKSEFSLDSLLAAAPNELRQSLEYLNENARFAKMHASPSEYKKPEVDADGFIVTAEINPDQAAEEAIVDGSWRDDVDFDENGHWEDIDEEAEEVVEDEPLAEEHSDPDKVALYRQLNERLTGQAYTLSNWSKTYHGDSSGKADVLDYRILVGEIDRLIGKGNHNLLLGVMLCREVHSDNPPGEKFVRFLLHFVKPQIDKLVDGQPVYEKKGKREVKVKVPNPKYREDFSQAIKETWSQIVSADNADIVEEIFGSESNPTLFDS